jgi:hypothetical protein
VVRLRRRSGGEPAATPELLGAARSLARPLRSAADLDPLLKRVGGARGALLGEAAARPEAVGAVVSRLATQWFTRHLHGPSEPGKEDDLGRADAGPQASSWDVRT